MTEDICLVRPHKHIKGTYVFILTMANIPDEFFIVQRQLGFTPQDMYCSFEQFESDPPLNTLLALVDTEPGELTFRTEPET